MIIDWQNSWSIHGLSFPDSFTSATQFGVGWLAGEIGCRPALIGRILSRPALANVVCSRSAMVGKLDSQPALDNDVLAAEPALIDEVRVN
jgi:hypothetical protein